MVQVFDTKYSHYKLIINPITPYCASNYNLNKHKRCLYIYSNGNKCVISQGVTMIVAMQHEKRSKWMKYRQLFLSISHTPVSPHFQKSPSFTSDSSFSCISFWTALRNLDIFTQNFSKLLLLPYCAPQTTILPRVGVAKQKRTNHHAGIVLQRRAGRYLSK